MRREKKRGSIQDIGLAMVFLFVAAILFLTVKYSYTQFVDTATENTQINSSAAAVEVLDKTKDLTNRFDYVVFVLLVGFVLAVIITGWLVGGNPLFSFIYFIALVILVAVSSVLSFVWEKVSTKAIFIDTVAELPITDLIMSNFPVYITILGFVGMLVLFAKPSFTQQ